MFCPYLQNVGLSKIVQHKVLTVNVEGHSLMVVLWLG